jgi:hypothetical protein
VKTLEQIEEIYCAKLFLDSSLYETMSTSLGENWHESMWQVSDNISAQEYQETLEIHERHRRALVAKLEEGTYYG